MTEDDLESHIEDILNALKDLEEDVSKEELEKELKKFMEYGVPIDQAKQTLIKKFGGSVKFDSSATSSERMLIADLEPNERSVNLLGHVIAINPKEITVKGDIHFKVFKTDREDKTISNIIKLNQEDRVVEVAKMLSGSVLSDVAIENARALLKID